MTKRPHLQMDDETELGAAQSGAELRLERALAATRRHFDGRPEQRMLTEQRILEHAWPVAPRRRPLWVLPLVALFAGSVAFAQELGALFDGARGRFFSVDERAEVLEPAPRTAGPQRAGTAPQVARAPSGTKPVTESSTPPPGSDRVGAAAAVASPERAPASVPVRVAPPASASRLRPAAAAASAPEPKPQVAAPDEFTLYREAHRAHFVDRDYVAALAHWDRYLAAARHGSMAPEARYNRALALYHLGRRDEASAALRPFAEGAYGRYRRDEAQRLLESLAARSP